jgi:uncharacterized protein (TIGR03437 family)
VTTRSFIFSWLLFSTQASAQMTCIFTVTPDHVDFTADGGDAIFKVTSNGTCGWTGTSDSAWVMPGPQSITNGQGSIIFQASSNQGPARKATLTIAGIAIPATQAEGHAPPASPVPAITSAGIVNGADYAGGGLVPGEVISIFGDNLGPATLAPLQIGADGTTLFTTLGSTQVLIGGDPVPLIFSQQKQVSAIVPYSISAKTLVDVQVKLDFVLSNAVTMPIANVSPALFSVDGTGKGQGAILNQNNSVNSSTNPAHPGDVLLLFGTGDGLRDPLLMEGQLTPKVEPLPRTKLPVQVTVGGISATVSYAGGAPGLVAGVLQVNIKLPDDVTVGNSVPVVLTVGTAASPATVTVAIANR